MEFKGKVVNITCHKDDGWGVYYIFDGRETHKVTGTINRVSIGDYLYVVGDKEFNRFGEQIKAKMLRQELPSNVGAFAEYLKNTICGIGNITASLIVNAFKEKTFDVIANEPEKLAQLRGISKKKAEDISAQFVMNNSSREEQMFFINLGISETYAGKIKEKYQNEYKAKIEENPYQLIKDIDGIGFAKADSIASKLGIKKDSPFRLKAGIEYTLDDISVRGNIYYPKDMLVNRASYLLKVSADKIATNLEEMIADGEIVDENGRIYLPKVYKTELNLVKELANILGYKRNTGKTNATVIKEIKAIEKANGVELDESQEEAVLNAIQNNITVITGGPGTGKTTTLNVFIQYIEEYEANPNEIVLCAPTGRAVKRMQEQTHRSSSTIHRLLAGAMRALEEKDKKKGREEEEELGYGSLFPSYSSSYYDDDEDEEEDYNPLANANTIIIDEMSMVDQQLMSSFIHFVELGTRLVFVGDVDQLPSVGAGTVLKDLINSETMPVARLTKIHRQANDSHIIWNAHKINNGELIDLKTKNDDFFFAERKSAESTIVTIKQLLMERIPARYNVDKFDIQVLAPMRKGELGVTNLNNIIQEFMNPPALDKEEIKVGDTTFREGDKVIHIKNDYNIWWKKGKKEGLGIFNGEIGKIIKIDKQEDEYQIEYEGRIALYNKEDLKEIELAYATTIHKSQGSEYPAIIIPLLSGGGDFYTRNLLYTAVTRAKDCVAILGNNEVVHQMIKNNKSQVRYTYLSERLNLELKETAKVGKQYA